MRAQVKARHILLQPCSIIIQFTYISLQIYYIIYYYYSFIFVIYVHASLGHKNARACVCTQVNPSFNDSYLNSVNIYG